MESRQLLDAQKKFFATGQTKNIVFRQKALHRLERVLHQHEDLLLEALRSDLNKDTTEGYMTEVGLIYHSIRYAAEHVDKWARPKRVMTPLVQFPADSHEIPEPYGCVLIMAPWNYPVLLCLDPLIGAIAAGNCCILKPSAYAPATSAALKQIIGETFPLEYVAVVEGGREENSKLLDLTWDYIFFTGGKTVGRLVMSKAAEHLTPVTLELGGKSPCIVDASADLNLAAKRVVFGKFVNGGQTCIAPDYLFVHSYIADAFMKEVHKWIRRMFGEQPLTGISYPKVINRKHYDRLKGLLASEHILEGGKSDEKTLQIAPTFVGPVEPDAPIMQEEIFGPIMPVMTFKQLEEVETYILSKEKPLALYLFTNEPEVERRILKDLSFGGGCVNDTLMHIANPNMGFGGVGASGMGRYHGKLTFDTFTHRKSVLKTYNFIDMPMRYRPYTKMKDRIIRKFLK